MTSRGLFIAGARTGPELHAAESDCKKIFDTLSQPRFGGLDEAFSSPLLVDCASDNDFIIGINDFFKRSARADQRIVYFTGHGKVADGEYGFMFDNRDFLPFSLITGMLKGKSPAKTLFILDTCHSGAADLGGIKTEDFLPMAPNASCIFASSRDVQFSHEDAELGSLFTHFLCECIITGNGGTPTAGGLITVPDAADYIRGRIELLGKGVQNPRYTIKNAEGPLWIAINVSGASKAGEGGVGGIPNNRLDKPCGGATMDDLDHNLLLDYARDGFSDELHDIDRIVRELELVHPVHKNVPTETAILCFGKKPTRFFPNAASMFSAGDRTASKLALSQVDGPLLRQRQELVQLTSRHLQIQSSFNEGVVRTDRLEIPVEVLREVIANALAHRDFVKDGRVHVHVDAGYVEISNPGVEPSGHSWAEMLDRPGLSLTPNRRVANLLQAVGGYDGIGRGFSVLSRYRKMRGDDSVSFFQRGDTVVCRLARPPVKTARDMAEFEANEVRVSQFLAQRMGALAKGTDLFGGEFDQNFVEPNLSDARGHSASSSDVLEAVSRPGAFVSLTGTPGSGKTYLLKSLAIRLAFGDGDRGFVPIYAALRDLKPDLPLRAAVASALGIDPSLLEHILVHRRAVLLFDGLDECPPAARISLAGAIGELRAMLSDASILVSSRPTGTELLPSPDAVQFRLNELRPQEVKRLIEQAGPKPLANEVWRFIQDHGIGVFGNPLMLRLLAYVLSQSASAPLDGDTLIARAIDLLWYRHDSAKGSFSRQRRVQLQVDHVHRILEGMALVMVARHQVTMSRSDAVEAVARVLELERHSPRGSATIIAKDVVDDFLETGFLVSDDVDIAFLHRSFVEHLAMSGAARMDLTGDQFARLVVVFLDAGLPVDAIARMAGNWYKLNSEHALLADSLRSEATKSQPQRRVLLEQMIEEIADKATDRKLDVSDLLGKLD
jgi:predicted ATPase